MRWRERREGGDRERERGGKGVMTARGAVSPFSVVPPKPWNEPIHDNCHLLHLISPTGSAIAAHTGKCYLYTLNIYIYLSLNMVGETVDNRFVAVQDQWPLHISAVKTVITSLHYNTKYFLHYTNNNHNSNNTQIANPPYVLTWIIITRIMFNP